MLVPCLLQNVLAILFAGVSLVTTLTTTGGTLQALEQGATLQDALLGALPGALAFFGLLGELGAAASRQQLARLPPSTDRTLWAAQIQQCQQCDCDHPAIRSGKQPLITQPAA